MWKYYLRITPEALLHRLILTGLATQTTRMYSVTVQAELPSLIHFYGYGT